MSGVWETRRYIGVQGTSARAKINDKNDKFDGLANVAFYKSMFTVHVGTNDVISGGYELLKNLSKKNVQ